MYGAQDRIRGYLLRIDYDLAFSLDTAQHRKITAKTAASELAGYPQRALPAHFTLGHLREFRQLHAVVLAESIGIVTHFGAGTYQIGPFGAVPVEPIQFPAVTGGIAGGAELKFQRDPSGLSTDVIGKSEQFIIAQVEDTLSLVLTLKGGKGAGFLPGDLGSLITVVQLVKGNALDQGIGDDSNIP